MMMRRRRLRLTIAGIMGVVACTAVALGCLIEAYRIRRTQAFYLRESARYAQLERSEINIQSTYSTLVKWVKMEIESMQEKDTERYKMLFERGRKNLIGLDKARINVKRYSELSRRYKEAGTCLWLPFGQNPLKRGD
jgi:hypothetical protein